VIRDYAGRSMGTSWSVRLVAAADAACAHLQTAAAAARQHRGRDEPLGGRVRPRPLQPRLRGQLAGLPPAFFDVLSYAMDVARASGGAYDPCAGALVNLWGFGPYGRFDQPDFVPPSAMKSPSPARNWRRGRCNCSAKAARLAAGRRAAGLSAVAKGYSVDRCPT
jgi:thiamine biosynthesis lipoprotein